MQNVSLEATIERTKRICFGEPTQTEAPFCAHHLLNIAVVALHKVAKFAAPDTHVRAAIALGATPGKNTAVSNLNNGKLMIATGWIGHCF